MLRRHAAQSQVAERGQNPSRVAPVTTLVRRSRLGEQVAVVEQRRRLHALLALEVVKPLDRELTHRDPALVARAHLILSGGRNLVVLRDELRHAHRRPLLVVPAVRDAPTPRNPAAAWSRVEPCGADAPLDLPAGAPPLRLEEGLPIDACAHD